MIQKTHPPVFSGPRMPKKALFHLLLIQELIRDGACGLECRKEAANRG
jgi:hypothetical protein